MKSYITSIGTATPEFCFDQMRVAEFMAFTMGLNSEDKRKLMTVFRSSGISYRYSVIPDYGKEYKDFTFYPSNESVEPFPDNKARMEIYKSKALPLTVKAIQNCLSERDNFDISEITHLVTISCTGMYAPGIDIQLISELNLSSTVQRTSIQFMGCYAAFNGLKVADHICKANPAAKVLVVCTELCTLHFQKENTEDNIVSNALFGDGAAAVLVEATAAGKKNFMLNDFHSDLALEAINEMSWNIGNTGFQMSLSSKVPDVIRRGIKDLTFKLIQHYNLKSTDIEHFAIHPGGRRIIQVIESELTIPREKNTAAWETLEKYGNLSSATILFVLKNIMEKISSTSHHNNVLGFAFGPGLTLEGMLLKIVVPSSNEIIKTKISKRITHA